MHDEPRRILGELIARFGLELHTDVRRTEALLRDFCPDYAREIFVLIQAQKQHVPAELLGAPAWMPQSLLRTRLVRRLQDNFALSETAAQWGVEAWAMALGLTAIPVQTTPGWPRQKAAVYPQPPIDENAVHNSPNLGKRLFDDSDVQLTQGPTKRAKHRQMFSEPLGAWWQTLLRSPVQLAVVTVVCAVAVVAGVGYSAFVSPQVEPATPAITLTINPVAALMVAYPLPRTAVVSTDALLIRSSPSISATAQGLLADGQEVGVIAFSEMGDWSQIGWPTAGWVSNEYLRFRSDGFPALDVTLGREAAQVMTPDLHVRSGPGTEFPIVGDLAVDQSVVIIATVTDGSWKQIVSPQTGWVSTMFVQVSE